MPIEQFYRGIDTPWQDDASCKGKNADLFNGQASSAEDIMAAKAICLECAVREECLEYALYYNKKSGIWGRKTPEERAMIRQQRTIAEQSMKIVFGDG